MSSGGDGPGPAESPLTAGLSAAHIDVLRAHGEERATARGDVLFREGDRSYDFLVILAGVLAAVDGYGGTERELGLGYPGDFVAELNLFTGERLYTTAVVREAGAVLAVPAGELTKLIGAHPDLGDVIMPVLLARRRWLLQHQAGFQIIGSRYSPDTGRLREFATRNRLAHSFVDLDRDRAASRLLEDYGATPAQSPAVLMRGGELLLNPSDAELARAAGLTAEPDPGTVYDLLVVGAGPAGLAASVYASSEGLRVATMDAAGTGGQIGTTSRVENYLGFPVGISGAEFATRAVVQAQRFGTTLIVPGTAVKHEQRDGFHMVTLLNGDRLAGRCLIIATGMQYRRLDVPGVERFEGTSVFYTPLGASEGLGEGDPVIVVGDGNSAGQAATFLAGEGHQVTIVILGADLSHTMASYLIDRIDHDPNIEVLPHSQVAGLDGAVGLDAAMVEDHRSGLRRRVAARAMFVLIGAEPHTAWLVGSVRLDEAGFVLTGGALGAGIRDAGPWQALGRDPYPLETSLPGMFAAGDVRADSVRRVGSAVGDGSLAAQLVHEWLGSSRGGQAAPWYGARTRRPPETQAPRPVPSPEPRT
jgi:thioredoxin reductase (NADPH)